MRYTIRCQQLQKLQSLTTLILPVERVNGASIGDQLAAHNAVVQGVEVIAKRQLGREQVIQIWRKYSRVAVLHDDFISSLVVSILV